MGLGIYKNRNGGFAMERKIINDDPMPSIYNPKMSQWECYMFGNHPEINNGFRYRPVKGQAPGFFIRFMMKICFDCTWVKTPPLKQDEREVMPMSS